MPQLSQIGEIYASQAFWLAIVFTLIYVGVGKAMVPRIEATIDDRAARVAGDLAAAEAARVTATAARERYEAELDASRAQATKAVADAQATASAATETRLKAGDTADDAKLDAAMARIAAGKAGALAEIEAATVEAVQAIVAKLSGAEVDRAAAKVQVTVAMAHG